MKPSGVLFAGLILAVAAGALAARLPRLGAAPMHCDEANQAVKAGELLETGVYDYDPNEHHGPTLYWLTLPSLRLSGARTFAQSDEPDYRIVPVVFGAGVILLLLLVGDGLGRGAAVVAAVLAAISPAMFFYSRYYIQEMLLVFFTFATIGCAWRYVRSGSPGWALAVGLCVGLLHSTKETWVIPAAAMVAGLVLTIAWTWLRDGRAPAVLVHLRPLPILAGVLVAVLVAVAFYSSFGRHWRGPVDSILAYETYWRRGSGESIHAHPWYYYFELLLAYRPARGFFWSEGLIVGLSALGCLGAILCGGRVRRGGVGRRMTPTDTVSLAIEQRYRLGGNGAAVAGGKAPPSGAPGCGILQRPEKAGSRPHPGPLPKGEGAVYAGPHPGSLAKGEGGSLDPQVLFCRFLAFYTLVAVGLYCAIPYKTPWNMLVFLHAMTLLAGVAAWAIYRAVPGVLPVLAVLLVAAGAAHLGWECYALNFRFAADPRNPYVYAGTSPDAVNLAAQMERLARASPEGHAMVIHVVTPENYWPLPWYLRRFNRDHVGYWQDPARWQRETSRQPPPSVIILTGEVQPYVDAHLRAAYNKQMIYGLRPGVLLSVYAREDVWQKFLSAAEKPPPK